VSRGVAGATDLVFTISGSSPFTAAIQHRHAALDGFSYPISLNPLGGNVGIGTNTPSTTLNVNGTTFLQGGQTTVRGSGTTSATTALRVENANASASLVVLNDGNIGINTSTPTTKLAIQSVGVYSIFADSGNSTPGGNNPWLAIYNSSSISAATYGWGWYDSVVDGSLSLWRRNFSTTGSLVLSFSRDNGNVGIGKTLPNAKLDVNGNALITGSLTVTGGITGSLLGTASFATSASFAVSSSRAVTASYATQALSASWAPGGGASFPYTGSAIITGSLNVIGPLIATQDTSGSLNTSTRQLTDSGNVLSIDWNSRVMYDNNGNGSLGWKTKRLFDSSTILSADWEERELYSITGDPIANWASPIYLNVSAYQSDIKSKAVQELASDNFDRPESYLGDIVEADGVTTFISSSVANGMLVYLDTDAYWKPVNQNSTTATKMLGIAYKVDSLNDAGYVLLEGHVVIDDTSTGGPNVQFPGYGLPVYIRDNTTAGEMSTVLPTSTGSSRIVRLLGYCYWNNASISSQWMMKFKPSNDWVQI
jgi:hypothetical protein